MQFETAKQNQGAGHAFASLVRQQQATTQLAKRHQKAAAHEEIAQSLLLNAKVWTAVQQTLWQVMAIAIMLVGVGVKLAIYSPLADPHAHYGLPLRLLVGISVTIVFTLQLFYAMVIRRRHLYHQPVRLIREQPAHALVVLVQVCLIVAQPLFGLVPLQPAATVAGQSAIGLAQCILLHVHEHRIKVVGAEGVIHPLAGVPDALEAIRLKASKRRLAERYQVDMQRIIKIQAFGRRRLARMSTKMIKTSAALG